MARKHLHIALQVGGERIREATVNPPPERASVSVVPKQFFQRAGRGRRRLSLRVLSGESFGTLKTIVLTDVEPSINIFDYARA